MSVWRFLSGFHVEPSNNCIAVANPLAVTLAGPLDGIIIELSKSIEPWIAFYLKLCLYSFLGSLKLSLVEVEEDLGWIQGWGIGNVCLPYLFEIAAKVSSCLGILDALKLININEKQKSYPVVAKAGLLSNFSLVKHNLLILVKVWPSSHSGPLEGTYP